VITVHLATLRELAFPEWTLQAACADQDPEVWFPTAGAGQFAEGRMAHKAAQAKAVCAECPVRTECLEFALESDSRHGVWGGLDEYERQALRRRRPWGRS
jgi:WhiB family redox-sensing transcriptional regulator